MKQVLFFFFKTFVSESETQWTEGTKKVKTSKNMLWFSQQRRSWLLCVQYFVQENESGVVLFPPLTLSVVIAHCRSGDL